MNLQRSVAILAFVAVSVSSVPAVAGEAGRDEIVLGDVAGMTVPLASAPAFPAPPSRPALLPALYVTLGAMQAWDIYSTRAAVEAGAREANPAASAFARNAGAMIGLKAVTTAGTIVFAERMWRKNKVGAVVMLVAINGATAAISMSNMRNARASGGK